MDIELREKVELYLDFINEYKKKNRFDNKNIVSFGALMSLEGNEIVNHKNAKEIKKYIKKKTKIFSNYRGKFLKVYSIMMNDREDYKEVFDNTKYIYERLLEEGIKDNYSLLYSSFILAKSEKKENLNNLVENFKYYSEEKELEFLEEDYLVFSYLSILKYKKKEIITILKFINKTFNEAKIKDLKNPGLFYFTLLISEENPWEIEKVKLIDKIEKALRIKTSLINGRIEIDSYIYSLVGLASNFVRDEDLFICEVDNIYNYLEEQKHFKKFKFNKNDKFKISLNIVLIRYIEYIKSKIISLKLNEEDFIKIIEEYLMLSIDMSY